MKIENLKELEALVKMCNKHGVSKINLDGIDICLDGAPDQKLKTEQPSTSTESATLYSDEDALLWSAS